MNNRIYITSSKMTTISNRICLRAYLKMWEPREIFLDEFSAKDPLFYRLKYEGKFDESLVTGISDSIIFKITLSNFIGKFDFTKDYYIKKICKK